MGVCNCSMYCCTLLYVHSSIAIILMGKRELIALLNLSSWCLIMVERLFLAVPRGSLQFVTVVFPDHTHLLFYFHSSFAIILMGKRELVALLSLSSWCLVMVVWLFLVVPWVCLQFVIVVFPDHTHLLFGPIIYYLSQSTISGIPQQYFKFSPPPQKKKKRIIN